MELAITILGVFVFILFIMYTAMTRHICEVVKYVDNKAKSIEKGSSDFRTIEKQLTDRVAGNENSLLRKMREECKISYDNIRESEDELKEKVHEMIEFLDSFTFYLTLDAETLHKYRKVESLKTFKASSKKEERRQLQKLRALDAALAVARL
jgi:predicted Holliday junction resolvase-like endonuclease